MAGEKPVRSLSGLGKTLLAVLGVVPALVLLLNYIYSRSPQIGVKNELTFAVRVYANGDYLGIVGPKSTGTFRFYSEKIFPVQFSWEGIRQKDQNGAALGDLVTGSIGFVDNHQTVDITNMTGPNDYFNPILSNNTSKTCKIYVNDGLPSKQYAGVLLPKTKNVNIGYYKWLGNSNVTVYCDDGPHWWGTRNGRLGPDLIVTGPSGQSQLTLTP